MQNQLPVKRLNRLSWLLSIIIGIIFFIISFNNSSDKFIYPHTFFTVMDVVLVGYSDVWVMLYLAKRFLPKSKKFATKRYLLTYPAAILIYLLSWYPIRIINENWTVWNFGLFLALIGSGIIINAMITIMHDSVLLYEHKLHSELELSRLKAANAEAMNLALKQQIQPHFLFNALNTLKALYHKDTNLADTYLVHMASFLRASISHHSSNISPLDEEVKLLRDYLEMQNISFGTALVCTIDLPHETLKNRSLPSFSLQPLLENAIKHNNFTRENPLHIKVRQQGDWLVVSNNLQKRRLTTISTNYGLANLAERYRLWSGDEIIIVEEPDMFSVSIKLLKNEDSNYRG
jgi:two-component system LytT family sensor kinase